MISIVWILWSIETGADSVSNSRKSEACRKVFVPYLLDVGDVHQLDDFVFLGGAWSGAGALEAEVTERQRRAATLRHQESWLTSFYELFRELTSLWRKELRSWCNLWASSCLCWSGSTSSRFHTLENKKKQHKEPNCYWWSWFWFPLHVLSCNVSPHPPEGALTPAGWRSRERRPSWCCGSDPAPPLGSHQRGWWRGCSVTRPAEPGEEDETEKKQKGKQTKSRRQKTKTVKRGKKREKSRNRSQLCMKLL